MCGIVGSVAQRDITPILVEGLKRLEYRGYDSCGVALYVDGHLRRTRSTQRVAELADQIAQDKLEIGRAHVWTPVTNAHLVCRLLLEKKKHNRTQTNNAQLRRQPTNVK